ncbi:6731_t:CDS:2 [Funneliformis geosporum]|uniref:6731_t:CDS:1 n=1 Tax=Funneliformis geosporum TaxID=1117311 RepID=A0A9W4SQK2_9GLOM|nr:6731_t:CDS:2 [Funneliformis geosporum]
MSEITLSCIVKEFTEAIFDITINRNKNILRFKDKIKEELQDSFQNIDIIGRVLFKINDFLKNNDISNNKIYVIVQDKRKEKWCSLCEVSFENIDLLKDHKKGSDGGDQVEGNELLRESAIQDLSSTIQDKKSQSHKKREVENIVLFWIIPEILYITKSSLLNQEAWDAKDEAIQANQKKKNHRVYDRV